MQNVPGTITPGWRTWQNASGAPRGGQGHCPRSVSRTPVILAKPAWYRQPRSYPEYRPGRPVQLAAMEEDGQPGARRFPCLHGHLYRGCHHPGLRRDLDSPWCFHAAHQLSHLSPDCHPGRCSIILEATIPSRGTPANIPAFAVSELRVQYSMREESGLRLNGSVPGSSIFLHLAGHGHWQRCGHGDLFPA